MSDTRITHPGTVKEDRPGLDRRGFLKTLGIAGASLTLADGALAGTTTIEDPYAILVDTTRCEGCRACEEICAETNGLPEPALDDSDLDVERTTSETQWTVINRYETDAGEVFVKRQCMHCVQPACASACLTKAMYKTDDGPVIWRESKCMGCRFCMISCPFDMPKFEYESANPKIQKCVMCFDRLKEGEEPACVDNCPGDALLFGRRSEVIKEARRRIVENSDDYVDHIYGEHEVGGTGWLYLSAVPFEQIGLRTDLGTESFPSLTSGFLYGVPVVFTTVPALLLGLHRATHQPDDPVETEDSEGGML